MFQFNFSRTWNTVEGGQTVYLVGQLNQDIPFLARTQKGHLVTPFILNTDEGTTMANRSQAYKLLDGKMVPVEIPPAPPNIPNRMVKLPTIVVNDDKTVKYYPFVAFDEKALSFHKGIKKGDTVVVCGNIIGVNIPGVGPRDVLSVEDVRLIRQSNRRIQAEAEE